MDSTERRQRAKGPDETLEVLKYFFFLLRISLYALSSKVREKES